MLRTTRSRPPLGHNRDLDVSLRAGKALAELTQRPDTTLMLPYVSVLTRLRPSRRDDPCCVYFRVGKALAEA